jgi:DNA-directed RNA polymerase specialized sigma24 family protein
MAKDYIEFKRPSDISFDEIIGTSKELGMEVQSNFDSELIIFSLSPLEVQLLLLKYIGFNYKEIKEITGIKTNYQYYTLNNQLKENVLRLSKI